METLFTYLLVNISLLVLVAAILTELGPLRRLLKRPGRSPSSQLCLGLIFGALSISNTYTGLQFQGAVVNTRVVSTMAAGLLGGLVPGVCAGLIGGTHRYFYDPEGFTSLACALGTFCFGLVGGLAYPWLHRVRRRSLVLTGLVTAAEVLQCAIILLLCRPFSQAVELEMNILPPKIVINSLGLVLFMSILGRLNRSVTIELVEQQYLALYIAQKCLPSLREGLGDRQAMQRVTDTVRETLPEFQVALTDLRRIAAESGLDWPASPLPRQAERAIAERRTIADRGGRRQERAVLAAPLYAGKEPVGALVLAVPQGPNLILDADVRTIEGLASLFSSMLELGEVQHQVHLRQQAELRALQSQINPHFLYNALNTISALCSTDPDRAKETILVLASYFRQTLSINEPFVTLEEELSNVRNYLLLVEARFEGTVHAVWDLPDPLPVLYLPPLILQPIVENAIRHGKAAPDDRHVRIQIALDGDRAAVRVSDRGKGFPDGVLSRLRDPDNACYSGLFNVQKRLRSIYRDACVFTVDSGETGSTVSFSIPLMPPGGLEAIKKPK